MKRFKSVASIICYILLIPIYLLLTLVATWYILPAFQTTFIGKYILSILNPQQVAIVAICIFGLGVLLFILGKIFNSIKSSKICNFYTHIITWSLAIILSLEALFTFFIAETLTTTAFELNLTRKISIGVGAFLMALYGFLHRKIGKLIDRKIQAYDTAKELNANGRSSVIWVNILKTIDFIFPEVILLIVLCFAFNFEISLYFLFILISFIIPIIGNMICDKRVKKESIRKAEEEREVVVNETAEAVVSLIKQTGDNSNE